MHMQIAQSRDCANVAQSMGCLRKAWIHALRSDVKLTNSANYYATKKLKRIV